MTRIYAVGDIHGRFDLLATLMKMIRRDQESRPAVPTGVLLLGDLIDRGPASAALVGWAMQCTSRSHRFVVLKGNHEAMMVEALAGDLDTLAFWLGQGGRETLASWGVPLEELEGEVDSRLARTARRAVGPKALAWLASLPVMAASGHHLFVHAGIRPGVVIERQREDDLLWIRSEFLESSADHGAIVVHGHTISHDGPEVRANRIGIDTDAQRSGTLTAAGIEGDDAWFITTGVSEDLTAPDHSGWATSGRYLEGVE